MKLYRTKTGLVIQNGDRFYDCTGERWDEFVNDDQLLAKMKQLVATKSAGNADLVREVLAPIGSQQELWACGVTYLKSKIGRQEESKAGGGADFYGKVYEAERPEVFFKATPHRVVGHGAMVNIRKDSTWDVPEPELTLLVASSGKIVGYTIGNDMSSRSIEGENPLYLPQAKTYDCCASLGPCVYVTDETLSAATNINLQIKRSNSNVFEGNVQLSQLKRTLRELVSFVFRECSFPSGCLIMTGTGIVPDSGFTLSSGDQINISIDNIGLLSNTVR